MWGDSKWKLEDLVNSTLHYVNERIPLKSRYVRANQVLYMKKIISKAIMVKSRLKNKYMKNMSEGNKINHMRNKLLCETFEKRKEKLFC